jgi:hypothetical protein
MRKSNDIFKGYWGYICLTGAKAGADSTFLTGTPMRLVGGSTVSGCNVDILAYDLFLFDDYGLLDCCLCSIKSNMYFSL